jgi:hypothetical protein
MEGGERRSAVHPSMNENVRREGNGCAVVVEKCGRFNARTAGV